MQTIELILEGRVIQMCHQLAPIFKVILLRAISVHWINV